MGDSTEETNTERMRTVDKALSALKGPLPPDEGIRKAPEPKQGDVNYTEMAREAASGPRRFL